MHPEDKETETNEINEIKIHNVPIETKQDKNATVIFRSLVVIQLGMYLSLLVAILWYYSRLESIVREYERHG